jgi:hypothetical protein
MGLFSRLQIAGPLAGSLMLAVCEVPALAHETEERPESGAISYDLGVEVQNDYAAHASDGNARNNLTSEINLGLGYQATESLSFNLGLKMEQVGDPDAGHDEYFEKHGAFVESLTVNYEADDVSLYAGKFTPNFGHAWDTSPGIYTKEFAKDYELSERWGLGGGLGLPGGPLGEITLSASAFFADRTVLSDSLFSRRGRTTKASGGPSNTDDLSSFAVALDGAEVPGFETLEYQIAFVHQGKGQGDSDDEQGVVAHAAFTIPFIGDVTLSPMVEYALFDGQSGMRGRDRQNLTAAARFDYVAWNLTFGYGRRHISETGLDDATDELMQLTVGYAFANGVTLDAGYGRFDEDSVVSDIIGLKLSFDLAGRLR